MHRMPGRGKSWDDFVSEAKRQGIDVIVCLPSDDEIQEKSPMYASAVSNNLLDSRREVYPIPDYDVPQDRGAFASFTMNITG